MNRMKFKSTQLFFMAFMLAFLNTYSQTEKSLEKISYTDKDSTQIDTSQRKSTFNGYPYAFYSPESKFAVGAGGIFIFYTGQDSILRPSKIGFGGYYSSNKQYKVSMNNVYYFLNNNLYVSLPLSYGYFVNKFWGVGDNTQDTMQPGYSQTTFSATLTIQVPPEWFAADRTGLIIDYDYTEIVDKMENEFLINDSIPGNNGGNLLGFGSDLLWDSRDNIFFPNSGGYQYFKAVIYPGIGGGNFALFELDVRNYRAFSTDHVLAGNFFFQAATGETPFYKLPALGGSKRMRGFFNGRYRDNIYMMLQLEYRQYFWKRFGFVVFAGAGNVSDEIMTYNFSNMKYSYGGGLRYLFNKVQKVNLRMDVGFGNDGNLGIYFGIEEAF